MNLIERVKNMLVTPKTEWNVVAAEIPDTGKILSGYIIPLTLAGAVAAFIGYGLIALLGVAVILFLLGPLKKNEELHTYAETINEVTKL